MKPLRAEEASRPVPVRLSPRELKRVSLAAELNQQTRSEFIRDAIISASSETLQGRSTDGKT